MNTSSRSPRLSQLGRPNRVQRPFKSHETCIRHPCGQSGAAQSLAAPGPTRQPQSPRGPSVVMPSSMSSLHDNKRTGQWRPKGTHHCNLCLSSQNAIKVSSFNQPGDWWSQTGSNRRPQACKASALPTELWPRSIAEAWSSLKLVGLSGLEPLTSRLSGVCSNHLSYRPSEKQTAFRRQFLVTGQLWAYRSG